MAKNGSNNSNKTMDGTCLDVTLGSGLAIGVEQANSGEAKSVIFWFENIPSKSDKKYPFLRLIFPNKSVASIFLTVITKVYESF